jgi:hemerythrin superfamily protein
MAGKYAPRNDQGDHRIKRDEPTALALLKEEHHRFRILFDQAEASEGAALVKIAQELCMRLTVHMTIEEELLYPALKQIGEGDEVDEGIVEHASAKALVAEIEQLNGGEPLYRSKVHVLGEETIHHIDEEDEELFADAAKAETAGKINLEALGLKMRARQTALYEQIATDGETHGTHEAVAEEIPSVG